MLVATPIASVLLTMLLGAIIFELIGFDGPHAIYETFITPIVAPYKWVDVLTKAAPLIIIALGLSLGNQAKIWNIGAEGQYIIGALTGAGVAFAFPERAGLLGDSPDDRGGDTRRHVLGGDPGFSQDPLSCLRGAVDPDARLCRDAGAELSDRRPVEGSERPQLPADAALGRRADPAPRPAGNGRSRPASSSPSL